jgi:hypothetical protein
MGAVALFLCRRVLFFFLLRRRFPLASAPLSRALTLQLHCRQRHRRIVSPSCRFPFNLRPINDSQRPYGAFSKRDKRFEEKEEKERATNEAVFFCFDCENRATHRACAFIFFPLSTFVDNSSLAAKRRRKETHPTFPLSLPHTPPSSSLSHTGPLFAS